MPASRKLDPAKLLSWSRQGLTAEQMKERLKSQFGITASLDLVRLRLREARQEADGREPAPRKRAASKTADLADAVQSAIAIAENLDLGEPDPDDFDQEQAVQELRRVLRALHQAADAAAGVVVATGR